MEETPRHTDTHSPVVLQVLVDEDEEALPPHFRPLLFLLADTDSSDIIVIIEGQFHL